MTALYIILGIALFLALILSIKVSFYYMAEQNKFSAILKVGFLKFRLFPKKKKKFKYKKLAKRLKGKKISKITFRSPTKKNKKSKSKLDVKEILGDLRLESVIDEISKSSKNPEITKLLLSTVKEFALRFRKKLKINIQHIHITVCEKEAGDSCIRAGVITQAVAYLLEFLRNVTNLSPMKQSSVSVTPVFDPEGYSITSEGEFSVRIGGALSALIASLFKSMVKLSNDSLKDTIRKDIQK